MGVIENMPFRFRQTIKSIESLTEYYTKNTVYRAIFYTMRVTSKEILEFCIFFSDS